jgi:hypothetical protein
MKRIQLAITSVPLCLLALTLKLRADSYRDDLGNISKCVLLFSF